jgi:hypothetical protein
MIMGSQFTFATWQNSFCMIKDSAAILFMLAQLAGRLSRSCSLFFAHAR